jgi:hypothetical protein
MTSSRGHGSVMAKLVRSGVEQDEARRYVRDHRAIRSSRRVGKRARRDKLFALILPIISGLP